MTTAFICTVVLPATPSTCLDVEGAVDHRVQVSAGELFCHGEITLVPGHDERGTLVPYGDPDHWISGGLLGWLRQHLDADGFRDVCDSLASGPGEEDLEVDAEKLARAHGYREGRADYLGRRDDVDAGAAPESWAWPQTGADEAYLNAIASSQICREIGIEEVDAEDAWEDLRDAWLEAFDEGYRGAHEACELRELAGR